jgi:hypothetical protein
VRSLLGGEVFPHEAMRWMGSLPPCTSLWLIAEYRGDSACLSGIVWSCRGGGQRYLSGQGKLLGALLLVEGFVLFGTCL